MKAMILAGGYGSRFLPVTKTIPKEMLPLVDKPALDFIIEELVQSGVKQILIITSRRKKSLEDYFDREIELENYFNEKDKLEKIESFERKNKNISIYFIRQQEMKGTGHAVLLGREFLNTPFILAYPDDLIFSKVPLAKQLIEVYEQTKKNVLAVNDCLGEDLSRYGIVDPFSNKDNTRTIHVKGIVEKPTKGTEPSSLVSIGRYLLTPDIFPLLEKGMIKCTEQEYFLTDALNSLAHQEKLVAHQFEGQRYDIGEPLGYLKSITQYALLREDLKDDYLKFLKEIILK